MKSETNKLAAFGLCALMLTACANEDETVSDDRTPAYPGYSYKSNEVTLQSGLAMHYLDEGSGDPIVLVHGVPTQAYLWRNVIPGLREHGRVIAPDHVNFGLSGKTEALTPEAHAENLAELIETLELTNITFVLHDWGVPIGLNVAASAPEKVRALVVFEGPALPLPSFSMVPPPLVQNLIDPATARPGIVENNWFIECFVLDPECGGSGRQWTDEERDAYRAPFATEASREQLLLLPQHLPFLDTTGHPVLDPDGPGGDDALPSPSLGMFEENVAYLAQSQSPKLVLYGNPGTQFNEAYAQQLQATSPNVAVQQVGSEQTPTQHFIQEDAPDELAATIATFIDGLAR